jgi:hypothetical protein
VKEEVDAKIVELRPVPVGEIGAVKAVGTGS